MEDREKVAVIGTNGLPAHYGGFETLTHYLTLNLQDDFEFVVYCSKTPKHERLGTYNNARLLYVPLKANGWQSVLFDIVTIVHAWFTVDKLLVLGNSGAIIFPFKFLSGKKLVLNIGGLDWARSKWSFWVKKYIQLSERICVRFSDVVITDNAHIQRLYKKHYGADSEMIEYGGDHAKNISVTQEGLKRYPFLKNKYILSVSRAQSDNNIHMLLSAFESCSDYQLVIISNWHTSEYGEELRTKYKDKFKHITIVDAVYDQQQLDMIRSNAWLYIHSHSFCGTAPSLVEAMNLRLPILCYNAETNVETTENKSLYFNNESELLSLLNGMTDDKIDELKQSMTEIGIRRYKWSIIAEKYKKCIKN